jgi:ankyrin repeat protein
MGALLRAGANINQRNLAGFTPLHQAARRGAYVTSTVWCFRTQNAIFFVLQKYLGQN